MKELRVYHTPFSAIFDPWSAKTLPGVISRRNAAKPTINYWWTPCLIGPAAIFSSLSKRAGVLPTQASTSFHIKETSCRDMPWHSVRWDECKRLDAPRI
jgi:hypothetical protein